MIDSFKGKYFFLSNFYNAKVTYDGLTFLNSEAAFQSAKEIDSYDRKAYVFLNPSEAKRRGRRATLRRDWDAVKDGIMYQICKAKFTQNPQLAILLLETGTETLVEGNDWGDKYWGKVDGVGLNKLGEILMRIRSELRSGLYGGL